MTSDRGLLFDGPDEPVSGPLPLMLRVRHWELLIVCVLMLGVFVSRETGTLPGNVIRLVDVVLAAAVLGLVLHVASVGRRAAVANGTIAAASIAVAVFGVVASSVPFQRVAGGASAYVLAVAAIYLLTIVLSQQHVTGDTLFGAVAAYLAVAVVFGMVYIVIARANPAAFEPPQFVVDGQTNLYYFSFVTVTSLGYGDISPASELTRILAPIEAVIGAVLIAVLVGRIVGLLVAQTTDSAKQRRLDAIAAALDVDETHPRPQEPG